MPSLRTLATHLLLAALAVGTWWLAESLAPKDEAAAKVDASRVDYYSKNIRRTVLTPEGTPKEVLFAETMTHYKDDNRTDMVMPVMTLYKKTGEEPWVVRSEKGTSLAGGGAVLLRGKVLITRQDRKNGDLKIITANVRYIPDRDYAETKEHVQILAKDDETSADGAEVYFEPTLKINLLADVRRKHETH
jgi:lipopolysaccharide export system protein LptC